MNVLISLMDLQHEMGAYHYLEATVLLFSARTELDKIKSRVFSFSVPPTFLYHSLNEIPIYELGGFKGQRSTEAYQIWTFCMDSQLLRRALLEIHPLLLFCTLSLSLSLSIWLLQGDLSHSIELWFIDNCQ